MDKFGGAAGIQAAAEVLGARNLRRAVEGGTEDVQGCVGEVVQMLEGCTEVGTRVLLPGKVEPLEKRHVLNAVVTVAGLVMKRDDEQVMRSGSTLAKAIAICQPLVRKLGREHRSALASEFVAACLRGNDGSPRVPTLETLHFIKHLARCLPGTDSVTSVVNALMAHTTEGNLRTTASLAAHLIAVHGVGEADDPHNSGGTGSFRRDKRTGLDEVRDLLDLLHPSHWGDSPSKPDPQVLRELHALTCRAVAYKCGAEKAEGWGILDGAAARRAAADGEVLDDTVAPFASASEGEEGDEAGVPPQNIPVVAEEGEEEEEEAVSYSSGGGVKITTALLFRGAKRAAPASEAAASKALAAVTHLSLDRKGIACISNLERCTGLKVLYLDDNLIEAFGAGLRHLSGTLTHLYAQDNRLRSLSGLAGLQSLRKLYVARNCLSSLAGIESLVNLEELHASGQTGGVDAGRFGLGNGEEQRSVFAGMSKLRVLKLSGVGLEDAEAAHISSAVCLEELDLSRNLIARPETMVQVLMRCGQVASLCLAGNPAAKAQKFRDTIVAAAPRLSELDASPVTARERRFIEQLRLQHHRSSGAGAKPALPPPSSSHLPALELAGHPPARTNSSTHMQRRPRIT